MEPGADPGAGWQIAGWLMFAVFAVGAVASVVAFVVFIIDVFTNPAVPNDRRTMWLLVLLFANVLAYTPYWYVIWWRGRPVSAAR
jgi:hypothetical protein